MIRSCAASAISTSACAENFRRKMLLRTYANRDRAHRPSLCEENAPMVIAGGGERRLPCVPRASAEYRKCQGRGRTLALQAGDADDLALQLRRIDEHPDLSSR